ncbi:hypothetical protein C8R48DRAFT_775282 [Suillus tomentosus]|nr:hypothetical protein C8R48DRAFT_775282 [Suillus tomentosus]
MSFIPAATPAQHNHSLPSDLSSLTTSQKRVNVDIDPVAEPALKRQRVEVEDLSPSPLLTGPDNDLYIAPIMPPASPCTENEIPRHASPRQVSLQPTGTVYRRLTKRYTRLYRSVRLDQPKGTAPAMMQTRSSGWIRGGMVGTGWRDGGGGRGCSDTTT